MLLFANEGDLPTGAVLWPGVYFHGMLESLISKVNHVPQAADLVASRIDLDTVEDGVYLVKVDGIEAHTVLYIWTPTRPAPFKRRGLCVLLDDVDSSETALKRFKALSTLL